MVKAKVNEDIKDKNTNKEKQLIYKKEKYCTAPHCQEEGQDG